MKTIFTNATIVTDGHRLEDHAIVVADGSIIEVTQSQSHQKGAHTIDLGGRLVAPGFIDLQINGAGGRLFQTDRTESALHGMAQTLRAFGVTSFLPTLTSTTQEWRQEAMDAIRRYRERYPNVALGLNLEGPFIDRRKAGMASADQVRKYEGAFTTDLQRLGSGLLYMTLAPEAITVSETKALASSGVILSLGHTDASFEQAMDMFDHGVKAATHIFNAMSGLAGRSPGVVGAIFESDSVFSSFIADGHHVHPANARLAGRLLGPTRLFLVSDGMPTLGSDLTEFEYQGLHITDRNGRCTTDDGTLAGTGIDILQACKNMSTWLDIDMAVALQMITSTPARVLGLDHRLGAIKPGAVADMVVLTEDYSVDSVVVGGQIEKPT